MVIDFYGRREDVFSAERILLVFDYYHIQMEYARKWPNKIARKKANKKCP